MLIEKVKLFNSKKEFFYFLLMALFILSYSLLIEFNNYKILTKYNSQIIHATVIKQYTKTKNSKTYQVLKLKSDNGFSFYSSINNSFPPSVGKELELEIWASKISFYQYLSSFYAYIKIMKTNEHISLKQKLNNYLDAKHKDTNISDIYKALFSATPLKQELQAKFSQLGVSHLLAISGFHLGVLASILFFIFKLPYKFLQNRYFPYRSFKVDSFIFISISLLLYLLFLDSPPSLLRAYAMMLVGFFLYDRGYKIVSMQTLSLSVIILISFFPRLVFSLGFYLSVAGVFYIFLFLVYFKNLSRIKQLILLPFWIYMMMLPYSLAIFSSFSLYHPLSILWSILFSIFYPISIVIHIIGCPTLLDKSLASILLLVKNHGEVYLDIYLLYAFIIISLLAVYKKVFIYLLMFSSILSLIYSIVKISTINSLT